MAASTTIETHPPPTPVPAPTTPKLPPTEPPSETIAEPKPRPRTEPPPGLALTPLNLASPLERRILYHQRKTCGWDSSAIPEWVDWNARRERYMFWITLPLPIARDVGPANTAFAHVTSPDDVDASANNAQRTLPILPSPTQDPSDTPLVPIGHIALDHTDHSEQPHNEPIARLLPPDTSLTDPTGRVLKFSTFFIDPGFGNLGLGRGAMRLIERAAREEPYGSRNCRRLTCHTLARRYVFEDDEHAGAKVPWSDGRGVWTRFGWDVPKEPRKDLYRWYGELGYTWYKDAPRRVWVALDGEEVPIYDGFFYKDLVDD